MNRVRILGVACGAALLCALPVSIEWSQTKAPSLALESAQARIGRPATPLSVAGVNRRVHRRAYYGAYRW
jgi:hypothetical protein